MISKSYCLSLVALSHVLLHTNVAALAPLNGPVKCTSPSSTALMGAARDYEDMSGLFPGDGPYVPAGLSAEEYQKLKSDEAKKQQRMNFGAWGPRFKRTETPDGDWMVMPSLWTSGMNPRARPPGVVEKGNNDAGINEFGQSIPGRVLAFCKNNGPGFLLAYVLLDLVAASVTMYKSSARKTIWSLLKYGLLQKKTFYTFTMVQTVAAKALLSLCLSPLMTVFLENANRRKLWTRRRTILTSSAAGMLALVGWAGLLLVSAR